MSFHPYIAPLAQKRKTLSLLQARVPCSLSHLKLIFFRERSSIGALEVLVGDRLREDAQRARALGVLFLLKRLSSSRTLGLRLEGLGHLGKLRRWHVRDGREGRRWDAENDILRPHLDIHLAPPRVLFLAMVSLYLGGALLASVYLLSWLMVQ